MDNERHILNHRKVKILQFGVPVANGKIFSEECIKAAVANPTFQDLLNQHSLFASVDCPTEGRRLGIMDIYTIFGAVNAVDLSNGEFNIELDILDTGAGRKINEHLLRGNELELEMVGVCDEDSCGNPQNVEIFGFTL